MAIPRFAASCPSFRRLAIGGLAGLVALGAAGCGDDPQNRAPAAAATNGLVVLSGDVGAARLTAYDATGAARKLNGPGATTAWISAGRRGTLLATLSDGTLRLSDRIRADAQPGWRRVPSPDESPPTEPLYFGQWAPSGDRFVSLASDFGENGGGSLFVVDPIADTSLIVPLATLPLPAPPAWIDDDRVAIATGGGLVIIDLRTGELAPGPGAELTQGVLLDASADGSRVALARQDRGSVEIRLRGEWLAGSGQPERTIEGNGSIGAIALDRRGDRLAIAWGGDPGTSGSVVVYTRASSWREAARIDLVGKGARAAVTWLP